MSTQTTMSTEEHEDRILRAILRTSQQAGKACDAARYDGRGDAPQRRQACANLRDFWSSGAPQAREWTDERIVAAGYAGLVASQEAPAPVGARPEGVIVTDKGTFRATTAFAAVRRVFGAGATIRWTSDVGHVVGHVEDSAGTIRAVVLRVEGLLGSPVLGQPFVDPRFAAPR